MKTIFIVSLIAGFPFIVNSQSASIGNSSPKPSAILDLTNIQNKGLLIPSMTTGQKNGIASPANGLLVYQTDSAKGFYFYDGALWRRTGEGGNAWMENDSAVYTFKKVGVGIPSPSNALEAAGNILVTAPVVSTKNAPTLAQIKTMVNNSTITYAPTDSTGRFFDTGGENGDYNANISNAQCIINDNTSSTGVQLTIETIDLDLLDSLIIRDNKTQERIMAIGNGYSSPGIFVFSTGSLRITFKSDNNAGTIGSGFSIVYKRLFPMPTQPGIKNFAGNSFYFDTKTGSLRAGFLSAAAAGPYSIGIGYNVTASGPGSISLGNETIASGSNSTALGFLSLASSTWSTALGTGTISSGVATTAMGNYTEASGHNATSMGGATKATGAYTTAMGLVTAAKGYGATVTGHHTVANGYGSFVAGMFNDSIVSAQNAVLPNTPIFIIGNGDDEEVRSNAMVVLKSGNVGIGTNTPRTKFHVANGTDADYTDGSGYAVIGSVSSTNLVFDNNEILARNNGAASNLILQGAGGRVHVGTIGALFNSSNILDVNGSAGKPGGGSWATYSDERLKQDITPYTDGLKDLMKIKPVWFRYNDKSGYDTRPRYVGILAQELQQVAPYMVTVSPTKKNDGSSRYLEVNNSAMMYMLINAVKEQQHLIEDMKKEITALKQKQ